MAMGFYKSMQLHRVASRAATLASPLLQPGYCDSLISILPEVSSRMLPEVCPSMTRPFRVPPSWARNSHFVAWFENMRSECYKSDLRHALSFAAIWQNCGCAGKGFPAVARVSFPCRIRGPGHVLTNPGSKRSHHRARLASAWRVPLPYSKSRPAAALMLPQKKANIRESSPVIRVQQRRLSGSARSSLSTFILEEAFMRTWLQNAWSNCGSAVLQRSMKFATGGMISLLAAIAVVAHPASEAGGEANLKLPELSSVRF